MREKLGRKRPEKEPKRESVYECDSECVGVQMGVNVLFLSSLSLSLNVRLLSVCECLQMYVHGCVCPSFVCMLVCTCVLMSYFSLLFISMCVCVLRCVCVCVSSKMFSPFSGGHDHFRHDDRIMD